MESYDWKVTIRVFNGDNLVASIENAGFNEITDFNVERLLLEDPATISVTVEYGIGFTFPNNHYGTNRHLSTLEGRRRSRVYDHCFVEGTNQVKKTNQFVSVSFKKNAFAQRIVDE